MFRIFTIIQKELKDLVRDRRTMFFMVVFPAVIIPLLLAGIPKLTIKLMKGEIEKTLNIAVLGGEFDEQLVEFLKSKERITIISEIPEEQIQELILSDSLDGGIVIPENTLASLKKNIPVELKHYFRSGKSKNISEKRILDILNLYFSPIIENRFHSLELNKTIFEPYAITKIDVASEQEKFGKTIGTYLPYMFLLFCFSGAMYPALDLGAGEKERGTLETILTSPANQIEILSGKFIVISFFGIMSVIFGLVGIFIAIKMNSDIPQEIISVALNILGPKPILLMLSLLFPIALFFASFLLSISFYAKSFKEAQSIMGPLNLIIILPIMIGLMPGITLDATTALIPILNVSLAMNDIIAGTLSFPLYLEVMLSLLFFTALSMWVSVKFVSKESVIFRG